MKTPNGRAFRCLAGVCLLLVTARPAAAGHYRWTTRGPEPGTIYQIVVNAEDSNRIYTYAGYYAAYLFETSDRGAGWRQNDGLIYVAQLAPHPTDGRVLYAVGASESVYGVFKTIDGGAVWTPAGDGLSGNGYPIAVAPSAPNRLYAVAAGSPGKVFRSDDGAASWTTVSSNFTYGYAASLVVDPQNPDVLYVIGDASVVKSVDGGATWNPGGALPSPWCLRADPSLPSTLYAGTSDSGVYKSVDGGASWNPANSGNASNLVRDIAIDPANPLRLFSAGGGGVFTTGDGGGSWSPVDLGIPVALATAVAIDPRDSELVYAAGGESVLRGGLFRSEDGGASWVPAQVGLSGYYSYAVAPHPTEPATAYAVSGARVFSRGGQSDWSLRGTAPYGLTQLVADPSDGDVLYSASMSAVLRSGDGGATWDPATTGISTTSLHRLAISPSATGSLLAATQDGLFGTTDSGGAWAPLLSGGVRAAAFDSADSSILYAGFFALANEDGLKRSDDGGVSWSIPGGLPSSYFRVSDIIAPPAEPASVYVAAGVAGVYRSIDRGLTFAPASAGLPTSLAVAPFRLAADPSRAQTLFALTTLSPAAATEGMAAYSVYRSVDGAGLWTPLPGVLPVLGTLDFAVGVDGRTLYASTLSGVLEFERSFADVPEGDLFWAPVDAAAMNRLTAGCGGGSYCPHTVTSRASVAVFLLRGKYGAAYAPPAASGDVFSDVPASSLAAAFIEELFREGITAGCESDAYCPSAPVSRAQIAIMLLKAKHGSDYVPPAATGAVFADVPADAFAAAWIEQLFAEGIAAGCGGGRFCPDDATSRAQAAAFAMRAFGLS